jgi:hypothetical protein
LNEITHEQHRSSAEEDGQILAGWGKMARLQLPHRNNPQGSVDRCASVPGSRPSCDVDGKNRLDTGPWAGSAVHDVEESAHGDSGDWVLPGEVYKTASSCRSPPAVTSGVYLYRRLSFRSNLLYRFDLTHSSSPSTTTMPKMQSRKPTEPFPPGFAPYRIRTASPPEGRYDKRLQWEASYSGYLDLEKEAAVFSTRGLDDAS